MTVFGHYAINLLEALASTKSPGVISRHFLSIFDGHDCVCTRVHREGKIVTNINLEQREYSNPELDRLTVKAIIEKLAKTNSAIEYGELAKIVGEMRGSRMSAQGFSQSLGRIQDYCKELGLPALSVLVVGASRNPGSGFVGHYRRIYPEVSGMTDRDIVRKEHDACVACDDWQPLYDKVGLKEAAPRIRNLMAEIKSKPIYEEGERVTGVIREEIKRNSAARTQCLALKGYRCIVCEKDLEEVYGVSGIIHVHHLKPLFESEGSREVDPEKDLVPVCPNCHAVIHSKGRQKNDCYTLDEVRAMLGLKPLKCKK